MGRGNSGRAKRAGGAAEARINEQLEKNKGFKA